MKEESKKKSKDESPTRMVPNLNPAKYSDGHPLDQVHYLESKIILKGDRFTSVDSFHDFAKLVRRAAKESDVDFSTEDFEGLRPQIREVLFLDTVDFRLYNHAFILRRRLAYEDGFPVGEPEIVFKFRHPDVQKAAEMDVRPNIAGDYRIKFKAEALPLKDRIGAVRLLFSHNVEFPMSHMHEGDADRAKVATLVHVFPALRVLKTSPTETVELVNQTAVEEVLLDVGMLDFGKGVDAKANTSVWRTRGDEQQLVGEFSFQCKFQRKEELHEKARKRAEQFFCSLQYLARDWVSLGTTKTGAVYRLKGNPPQSHE
jgi:hypothetical protein